jgi:hypothetical protein
LVTKITQLNFCQLYLLRIKMVFEMIINLRFKWERDWSTDVQTRTAFVQTILAKCDLLRFLAPISLLSLAQGKLVFQCLCE